MSDLAQVKGQFPGFQDRSFRQTKDRQASQFQAALGAAETTGDIRGMSQKMAGAAAAQQAEAGIGAQNEAQTRSNQMRQINLQQRATEVQDRLHGFEMRKDKKQQELEDHLSSIDSRAKQTLFDEQMKIRQDAEGRAILTERQLMDYAILKSRNEQEYLKWAQESERASQREIDIWSAAANKLATAANRSFAEAETAADRAQAQNMARLAQEAAKRQKKAEADAANRRSMWVQGGTIVGAVAGGVVAGVATEGAATPAGVAAGASAGAALGGALGSVMSSQTAPSQ